MASSKDFSKTDLLATVPEGSFRKFLIEDLDRSELEFQDVIGRYFRLFVVQFFDRTHDFWKCFVDTMSVMFACERDLVLSAIDDFASSLLYDTSIPYSETVVESEFAFSESIAGLLRRENMPRLEKMPPGVELYVGEDNVVRPRVNVDEGQFLCDLPGFMLHADEVEAGNGIPRTCLAVTDQDILVDMADSSFPFAHLITRSFHFNSIVKLYRLGEEPRVGLFATRLKGPLSEERGKRGMAIGADKPVILPFDGELPFPVPQLEWKDKKGKPQERKEKPAAPRERQPKKKPPPKKPPVDIGMPLTLLSGFLEDFVPPMPVKLLTEKELEDRRQKEIKMRARAHRNRDWFD
jgi:hypothetical protein